MACERYRDALSDVAAGEPAGAALEAHLESCEACRGELAVLRGALALVDAELAELVAAEPSPALAARTRASVAASEASSGHRMGWLLPGLAAAAALIVALTLALLRTPSPEPERSVDGTPSRPAEADPAAPEARPVAPAPVRSEAPAQRSPAQRRRAAAAQPEVLVPPGEAEALLRLVALVHHERQAPPVLATASEPVTDLAELAPIDIQPLEIVPLDPAEASGT